LLTVLERITMHAQRLLESDDSEVYLLEPDGQVLHAIVALGEYADKVKTNWLQVGEGIVGYVAQSGIAEIVNDVYRDSRSMHIDGTPQQTHALICAPLISKAQVIGVMALARPCERGPFGPADLNFLTNLARQATIAIENARLFEAERAARERAETLQAATQALSATLDLQQVFELILSELQKVLSYDSASVQQLTGDQLKIIGGHGFPNLEEIVGLEFDPKTGDNPNQEVVRTKAPFIVGDAPVHYSDFHRAPHAQAGIRSWLGVPLLFGNRLIGIITLDKKVPGFYTEEHARLALAFAAQAAVAIENARLYAEAQERAKELTVALARQEELDRLKSEFIQNVSHELRTPMSIILGYAELLNSGELGDLQPDQRGPVAVIARRGWMLKKLVEDLTTILEAEAGRNKFEPVDLTELVHTLLADFQVAVEKAGLSMIAEITPDLPPVFGDPAHLRRVLDNLLGNALKFTSSGGVITVRLRQEGANMVLKVTDTGTGIPQDKLERIFDRFYQVDGSMRRRYGGVGLGLALVKEIVEAHGGQVSAESEAGRGSTFTVTLPVLES